MLYRFVTGTYFGNDEVQEDNTGHYNNYNPYNPEEYIIKGVKKCRSLKVKVSQGYSEHRHEVLQAIA